MRVEKVPKKGAERKQEILNRLAENPTMTQTALMKVSIYKER